MTQFHGQDLSRGIGPVDEWVNEGDGKGRENDAYVLTSPSSTTFSSIQEVLLHAVAYVGTEFG